MLRIIKTLVKPFFLSILFYSPCLAQIVDNGQNPPGLKWKTIHTGNFQVLFPGSMQGEAQRMANLLEYLRGRDGYSLHTEPRPVTVILQNQTVISNGFVALGPRRSEFFTTYPQQTEPIDWLTNLAVHELRHVNQIDKTIRTRRVLQLPLIEEIQFAAFGAAVPLWLIEGDAVVTETALTRAGRGRMPGWEKEYRANFLSGKNFGFAKYYMGSYKDNIPSYYQLGYFMASKLRRDYPDTLYNRILERSMKTIPMPWSYPTALNKYTGLNTYNLFHAAMGELKTIWEDQLSRTDTIRYAPLNKREDEVTTHYLLPRPAGDGAVIVLKRGLAHAPVFVRIDSAGREKKLLKIGPQRDPHFDYAAGKLVWDELRYDPRYEYRNYSVINIYDTGRKQYRQLTRKTRLFAPAISNDGKKIAAVKVDESNKSSLVILDAGNGKLLWESRKFTRQLHTPSFDAEGARIVFMLTGGEGRSMGIYEPRGFGGVGADTFRIVLKPGFFDASYPRFVPPPAAPPAASATGERIVFSSHYQGIDNIYALDPENSRVDRQSRGSIPDKPAVVQLTFARFGAYYPDYDPDTRSLLFNHFVPEGMDAASIPFPPPGSGPAAMPAENTFTNYSAPVIPREKPIQEDSVPRRVYPVADYKGPGRWFYFHSISPNADIGDEDNYRAGIRLRSNNMLNTLGVFAGYDYNLNTRGGEYTAGVIYKKYYPQLRLEYTNRRRKADVKVGEQIRALNWRESLAELMLDIPLRFPHKNYWYTATFSGGTEYIRRYRLGDAPENFIREVRFPLTSRLSFTRQRARSQRDLGPGFAQSVSLKHKTLAFDKRLSGEIWALRTLFYFPGLFRHHVFSVGYNHQWNQGQYRGQVEIPEISGAGHFSRNEPLENTLLVDYRFPLFYPDVDLLDNVYIKRVKAGLFADYENMSPGDSGLLNSLVRPDTYGFELRADVHFFKLYRPEFDIGTKLVFFNRSRPGGINQQRSPVIEFLFNFSI